VFLFLHFVFAQGPVLLLAILAWRWNEAVRWMAGLLLTTRGLGAIVGPASWALLGLPPPSSWQAPGWGPGIRLGYPYLNTSYENLVFLAFHLLLAVLLAARSAPQPGPERRARPGEVEDTARRNGK
jgi:hypothetical protein